MAISKSEFIASLFGILAMLVFCLEGYKYVDVFWSIMIGLIAAAMCAPVVIKFSFKLAELILKKIGVT